MGFWWYVITWGGSNLTYKCQVGVVVMTSACHAGDQGSISCLDSDNFLWNLYVYCTSIIWFHVLVHQYASPHPKSTFGVVVLPPASLLGDRGSNPIRALLLWFFVWIAQTLRAKITPFPRKDFGKNLPKRSTNRAC